MNYQYRATTWLPFASALLAISSASAAAQSNTPVPVWKVSERGAQAIGEEGDPNKEFTRVFAPMRTSTGQIVIPDFGTSEIRIFSGNGTFERKFGRRGSGPGEVRSLYRVGRIGDSIVVSDVSQSRISVFHPVSGFARQQSLVGLELGHVEVLGVLGDGALVVHPLMSSGRGPQKHGVWRDSMQVGLVSSFDQPLRSAWTRKFPGSSHLTINPKNEARAEAVGNYPFGPNIRFAVLDSFVLIGDSHAPELTVLNSMGQVVRTIRLPLQQRAFDNFRFDLARREAIGVLTDPLSIRHVNERYNLSHRPQNEPLYGQMFVSRDGLIWIERYRYLRADPTEFLVFSPEGKLLATAWCISARPTGSSYCSAVCRLRLPVK